MLRAFKCSRRADKRSGNHAPNGMFARQQTSCNLTHMVEFRQWNNLLIRGHLEDTIGRGIEDGATRSYMLLTQFLNDLGAGSCLVADDLAPNRLLKCLDHIAWEAVRIGR